MTISALRSVVLACAMAVAVQPQLALATQCIEQEDLADTVIYAVPLLTQALEDKCSGELSPDGFLAREGDAFIARYSVQREDRWPAASRTLVSLVGSRDKGGSQETFTELIETMPQESLQPFVDGLVVQEIAKKLKHQDCTNFERGLELLAPVPVENVGSLMAFLFEVSGVENPSVCPYRPE